jgi:hypothetical protein
MAGARDGAVSVECPRFTKRYPASRQAGFDVTQPVHLEVTMRLVNIARVVVPERKITEYLLSSNHPVGRYKAAFFTKFGFQRSHWEELADALGEVAHEFSVTSVTTTVWAVETGSDEAVLVTAYPGKQA